MAAHDSHDSVVALTRFGLGPRPGDRAEITSDPKGFVLAQIGGTTTASIAENLPDTGAILSAFAAFRAARADGDADAVSPIGDAYRRDVMARARHAVDTETPFVERLTMFWSNFFAISGEKGPRVRGIAGAYEREAIRPHVLGRFADMLTATTQHAAMLVYLDNSQSIGPSSRRGLARRVGLNENLARETLELHSLGVDGGYTQADVTALANIITGWQDSRAEGRLGAFVFNAAAHEPGPFTVLGRDYDEPGVRQGESVLADLAAHPSTARFVAQRLAQHFVSDRPPADLVDALGVTFAKTDGDLRAVAATLASTDSAWAEPPVKFVPPYDLMVAAHRVTGLAPTFPIFGRAIAALAHPAWTPDSPKGWPDGDLDWAAPDALVERLDWASRVADASAGTTDVVALADDILGPRLRPETRLAVARAESRQQGLALLIASAEFQTR